MRAIRYNVPEIRRVRDREKTMTRIPVRPQYKDTAFELVEGQLWEATPYVPPRKNADGTSTHTVRTYVPCKQSYYPGDILYVQETFHKDAGRYLYRADYSDDEKFYRNGKEVRIQWNPSVHMTPEAARLFLRVTKVRVERLQDISNEEAVYEGAVKRPNYTKRGDLCIHDRYRGEFKTWWNDRTKEADMALYGWDANPWVYVVEFERISREETMKHGKH